MESLRKIFMVLGALLPWFCSCSEERVAATSANLTEQREQGKALYEQSCAQCHYDGTGNPAVPDLRGSSVLAEPPQALARVILGGRQGVSMKGGEKFNGIMPPQPYLRDDEVAAIVVYVRSEFGSRLEGFSPQEAAKVRAEIKK